MTRHASWLLVSLLAMFSTPTLAQSKAALELTPRTEQGLHLMVPKGWTVASTQKPVVSIQIEKVPGSKTDPSFLIHAFPLQYGPTTAQKFAQRLKTSITSPKLVSRQAGPHGSVIEVIDGTLDGVQGRVALLHWANVPQNSGMTAVFAAPPREFQRLGGTKLLLQVLRVHGTPASAKPTPQATTHTKLNIPKQYHASGSPTLYFLAENLPKLNAAQIAAGMRQLNATERLSLGIYSAFGNMLHGIACSHDPFLPLVTSTSRQTCQQTRAQWAQTLQLTQGNKARVFDYALRQRLQYLTGIRCGNGQISKGTCNMYLKARKQDIENNHKVMTRIIANIGGGCVVGEDANCVP